MIQTGSRGQNERSKWVKYNAFWRVRGMEKMTTKHLTWLTFIVTLGGLLIEVAKLVAAAL